MRNFEVFSSFERLYTTGLNVVSSSSHCGESVIFFLFAKAVSGRCHRLTLVSVAAIFLSRNKAYSLSLDATSSEEHAASNFRFEEKC